MASRGDLQVESNDVLVNSSNIIHDMTSGTTNTLNNIINDSYRLVKNVQQSNVSSVVVDFENPIPPYSVVDINISYILKYQNNPTGLLCYFNNDKNNDHYAYYWISQSGGNITYEANKNARVGIAADDGCFLAMTMKTGNIRGTVNGSVQDSTGAYQRSWVGSFQNTIFQNSISRMEFCMENKSNIFNNIVIDIYVRPLNINNNTADSSELKTFWENYTQGEVACGTWIDGRTVYRKTYVVGTFPAGADTSITCPLNIENFDILVEAQGMLITGGTSISIPGYTTSGNIGVSANKTDLYVFSNPARSGATCYVTIKYLKTS